MTVNVAAPRVWVVAGHSDWGDHIQYEGHTADEKQHRWVGWTTPRPKVGDLLETQVQSGRTARFAITEVKRCTDPGDMWFARTAIAPTETV